MTYNKVLLLIIDTILLVIIIAFFNPFSKSDIERDINPGVLSAHEEPKEPGSALPDRDKTDNQLFATNFP